MNRLFVADRKRVRLFRRRWFPHGRLHLELEAEIENDEEEREHGRPSARIGRGGTSYAAWGHEDEARMQRWTKRVAAWLEKETEQRGLERAPLLAPARLCGELRKQWPAPFAARVEEHQCDVARLAPADLVRHRTVRELLTS